jgi:hypothetical protein
MKKMQVILYNNFYIRDTHVKSEEISLGEFRSRYLLINSQTIFRLIYERIQPTGFEPVTH